MSPAVRFSFRAPLAAWSTSGLVIRTTDLSPSWSGIVGLIGAAFGWPRDDARLFRFAEDYAMAVRIARQGERIEDYHTVQSPDARTASARRFRTRSEELGIAEGPRLAARARELNTTITRREYLADVEYEFAIIPIRPSPEVTLKNIVSALRSPVYPLYAGRRSCVLGRVRADVVDESLDALLADVSAWDARLPTARVPTLIRERRDMPIAGRLFAVRRECCA